MKLTAITENLRQRMGIAGLNAMQQQMSTLEPRATATLSAPTGSGKTIAFALPLLRSLGRPGRGIRAVVIAPSRELVMQIADVIRPVATGFKTVAFYGGHPMAEEVKSLSVMPDIVVATPGRLLDHLNRATLSLAEVGTLVLDEYDKSLELGFEAEMKRLCKAMESVGLLILTSATPVGRDALPGWLPSAGGAFVEADYSHGAAIAPDPEIVEVESPARDKLDTLSDLLLALPCDGKAIVFVNHRDAAERIFNRLKADGLPVGLYHGGLDQPQRENAVEMLENGTTPILVSTDLGARGLDIEGVDAVVHYHMPLTSESWTHRNGRTARQGAPGTVYMITSEADDRPDFVPDDARRWTPRPAPGAVRHPVKATLHFNLGKKEKISRGDIAGFLIAKGGLRPAEVGRIAVRDHCALVAVPAHKARAVLLAVASERLKAKRVRVTRMGS